MTSLNRKPLLHGGLAHLIESPQPRLPHPFALFAKEGAKAATFFGEAYSVITNTQPQVARFSLRFLDVALTCFSEAMEGGEDAHSSLAVEPPKVRAGVL